MALPPVVLTTQKWTRLGSNPADRGPALICVTGQGEAGKTRFACSAPRACPDRFGKRALYIAIDPESEALGPVLLEDRPNLEKVRLNMKADVFEQMKSIYEYDWRSEGITTCITDTMTVLSQTMLAQLTDSGKFSDRHIDLGSGVKQPMQGDFLATQTLIMALLRKQQQSGMNHLTLFHDQEVRPDAGQPGEPIGGPATVGKASVRSIVNWYNTVLHLVKRQKKRTDLTKPIEYERVVHTAGHGIWQAKLRTPKPFNPEIIMEFDPANVWRTLEAMETSNA